MTESVGIRLSTIGDARRRYSILHARTQRRDFQLALRILLTLVFFFPNNSIAALTLFPIAASIIVLSVRPRLSRAGLFVLFASVTGTLFAMLFREYAGLSVVNARDFTEIIRLIALASLVFFVSNLTQDRQFIVCLFVAFLAIDLIFSFSQLGIFSGAISEIGAKLYYSDFHAANSLGISRRALGLFPDPTTHGLAMSLVGLFFLNEIRMRGGRIALLSFFVAVMLLLLSQSQTAFLSFAIGAVSYIILDIAWRPKLRFLSLYVLLFAASVWFLVRFQDQLKYLFTLFSNGLGRNSFQRRLIKRDDALDLMHSEPLGMYFGWGKNFLGGTSSALDNEYLFVYLVVGLPGLLMFLTLLTATVILALQQKDSLVVSITICGALAAYPASFFTNIKIFALYCIILSLSRTFIKLPKLVIKSQ